MLELHWKQTARSDLKPYRRKSSWPCAATHTTRRQTLSDEAAEQVVGRDMLQVAFGQLEGRLAMLSTLKHMEHIRRRGFAARTPDGTRGSLDMRDARDESVDREFGSRAGHK